MIFAFSFWDCASGPAITVLPVAVPPPPPIDCARMPIAAEPSVPTVLPGATLTVTVPPGLPAPPACPTPTVSMWFLALPV